MKKLTSALLPLFFISALFAENKNLVFKENYNNIKSLNIELHSEALSIKEIYGDELSVEIYTNNKRFMPTITNTNDILSITSSSKSMRFGEYCNVEIYIPQDYKFKTVALNQSSGALKIENLNAENIAITATSGALSANSLSADYKLKLQRSSGATKIETAAADDFELNSTSGSVKINKINSIDSSIISTSGSISINKMDTESFDLKSTSGSVMISKIACDFFTLNSTSGSTNLEFESVPTATSRIRTTSGSVKLYFPSSEGFDLLFSTNSGSFTDSINGERNSPHGSITNSYFGGGSEIIVSTTSGSLSIEK